jgi:hypothetical protein
LLNDKTKLIPPNSPHHKPRINKPKDNNQSFLIFQTNEHKTKVKPSKSIAANPNPITNLSNNNYKNPNQNPPNSLCKKTKTTSIQGENMVRWFKSGI